MTSAVLARQTLVLNRSWLAIATTPVRDALSLLYTGAARAIEPQTYQTHDFESWSRLAVTEDEPYVSTVSMILRAPEVVVLRDYSGVPRQVLPFTRRNLMRRDEQRCQYCGRRPSAAELSIDHVLPRSRGGETSWENCVLACVGCNARKADRTLREAGLKLLRKPERPRWTPYLNLSPNQRMESWTKFTPEHRRRNRNN